MPPFVPSPLLCGQEKFEAENPCPLDAHIRIWSTEAIYNSHDPSYIKPKQLAALSTHSGTIHAVRFSSNNKYLASGADDKIVCIYALDPGAPAHAHAFGSYYLVGTIL